MTITITLPPEAEEKLRSQAAESGLAPDDFAQRLIGEGLNGGARGAALDRVLAPLRKEVEDTGITDDALRDFFTEARDEMRAEKRAQIRRLRA